MLQRTNHVAVIVTVVLHQILGFLWYSVAPWAVPRLEALGKPASDVNAVDPVALGLDIVGWILAAYVVAWLIQKTGVNSAGGGAMLAVILWLGLALPTLVPHYAFAGLQTIVTVVDAANVLVALLITAIILAVWPARSAA